MNNPVPLTVGKKRRGAAAAELVVILPVMLFLVLGCVDFGRFAWYYIAVTNAARAGAGFGSVQPPTTDTLATWQQKVSKAAIDEMTSIGTPVLSQTSPPVLSPAPPSPLSSRQVQVTVKYTFTTFINWPGLPHNTVLQRTATLPLIQ